MTTAFVLSGGGSLGAVQVGMLQALEQRGVRPDLLVGTSAGAVNAAFVAAHGMTERSLGELEALWSGLRRRDVFPLQPRRVLDAMTGRAPSLCPDDGLRRLLDRHLGIERLEHAATPVHVIATDVRSGRDVALAEGPAVEAVLASAAIPGVLPSVPVDGRHLIDGGVANNAAVSEALACGADVVYVLPAGYACALAEPPGGALASAVHALTILITQRLFVEIAQVCDRADIRVLPPLCPLAVSSADFRQGAALVERARSATGEWLDAGSDRAPHPEKVLSLHDHHQIDRQPQALLGRTP